ncbi:MAG: hypothetical protein DMG04_12225 [Acidobacteria bacterium]|nr:MAG: hypothetical protein DMG04_12225 [Acidobacteriota bacterium]PYR10790.1 MAG: hypothetical protein DMF99_10805 [Acidobacteriota bacterium]
MSSYRRSPSGTCSARNKWVRLVADRGHRGVNSCSCKRRASSPSISSRSGCDGCTSCSFEVATRRVHFAGCSAHPDSAWVTQQARQVTRTLAERPKPIRLLIRDHDRKFTRSFDEVFQGAGIRIVRTPIQAPLANGIAERFVRTVRSECLDWLLIANRRHLGCPLGVH